MYISTRCNGEPEGERALRSSLPPSLRRHHVYHVCSIQMDRVRKLHPGLLASRWGLYLAIILLLLLQILPLASSTPSVCSFSLSRYRPPPLLLSHNRAIPCHTSSTILLFRDFLLYQIPRLLLLLLHRPKPSPPYSTLLFDKTPLCSVAPLRFITTLLYSSFFFRPSPP